MGEIHRLENGWVTNPCEFESHRFRMIKSTKKKPKPPPCPKCKSTGSVYVRAENVVIDCPDCKGKGHL